MARNQKPFDKIVTIRSKLEMYVQYGDATLRGQSIEDFIKEINECFNYLMDFRNIVNGMVSFDTTPTRAALMYIPENEITESRE